MPNAPKDLPTSIKEFEDLCQPLPHEVSTRYPHFVTAMDKLEVDMLAALPKLRAYHDMEPSDHASWRLRNFLRHFMDQVRKANRTITALKWLVLQPIVRAMKKSAIEANTADINQKVTLIRNHLKQAAIHLHQATDEVDDAAAIEGYAINHEGNAEDNSATGPSTKRGRGTTGRERQTVGPIPSFYLLSLTHPQRARIAHAADTSLLTEVNGVHKTYQKGSAKAKGSRAAKVLNKQKKDDRTEASPLSKNACREFH